MEKFRSTNVHNEQVNEERRSVVFGLGAAAVAAALPNKVEARAPEHSPRPSVRPERSMSSEAITQWEAVLEDYTLMLDRLAARMPHFVRELPHIIEQGLVMVPGTNPPKSRLDYLATELRLPRFNVELAELLQRLLPAKAAAESGLDPMVVSSAGARGILQFMPETWREHGSGDILSLSNQVEATGSLLNQNRLVFNNRCQDAFGFMQERFFNGDESAFCRWFLLPSMLNSFNAGAGTMSSVINGFAEDCSATNFDSLLQQHNVQPRNLDVYGLMSKVAPARGYHDLYRSETSQYVVSVLAAHFVLEEYREEGQTYADAFSSFALSELHQEVMNSQS
jgi:hypothetical protein